MTPAPANDRATVIAHALKGRRSFASTCFPFDEARLSELIGASYDRSFYPQGSLRQWSAIMASPTADRASEETAHPRAGAARNRRHLDSVRGRRHTAQCIPGAEYHEIEGLGARSAAGRPARAVRVHPAVRRQSRRDAGRRFRHAGRVGLLRSGGRVGRSPLFTIGGLDPPSQRTSASCVMRRCIRGESFAARTRCGWMAGSRPATVRVWDCL